MLSFINNNDEVGLANHLKANPTDLNKRVMILKEPSFINAAKNEHMKVLDFILSQPGINFNAVDGSERNLLHVAAKKNWADRCKVGSIFSSRVYSHLNLFFIGVAC